MHPRRMLTVCLWSVLAAVMIAGPSMAGDVTKQWHERERRNLEGLPGVWVLVENIAREAERDGLTTTQLQTDVELRLRKAGIQVLTTEAWRTTLGSPSLDVNIHLMKDYPTYIYHIHIKLDQDVFLARDRSLWFATTWERGVLGRVGIASLRSVRDSVGDLVDEFVNDFLAANPSLAPATIPGLRPPVALPPSLVYQVQVRLVEAGFGPGTPDGKLGPQTQNALRQVQRASNLPVTGSPNQATLEALGIWEGGVFPTSTPGTPSNTQY
jgi:hypothetical protein